MHLRGAGGNEFELRFTNYEFPEITESPDSEWLIVDVSVRSLERQWQASHASLMVGEAHALSHWLWQLSKGAPVDECLEFTEPNLRFSWSASTHDSITIRAYLSGELLPPGVPRVWGGADCYVDLTVSRSDLFEAFWALQVQLRGFPPRGIRG